MFLLETSRLILVPTPVAVMERRLVVDSFTADVPVGDTMIQVTFPPEWPGDALVIFPMHLAHARLHPNDVRWGGTIIDRAERVAVGTMGAKGKPDAEGSIEIGYGIISAYQGRGYATEMAGALVEWLFAQPNVRRVTAETLVDNRRSIRVLEKLGFRRIGERVDEEEGPLIVWAREESRAEIEDSNNQG